MDSSTCSLLITTYNWKEALRLSVESAFRQTLLPREIIIADDGSRDDTRKEIDLLRARSPIPIVHVWQPDEGFQAAKIRNRGIAAASGDYIVCIDGDILLDPYFVEDHLFYAQPGCCVCAKRVKLLPKSTETILARRKFQQPFFLSPQIRFGYNFYAIRNRFLCNCMIYKITDCRLRPRIMSANMAFWKSDAVKVNGFDEAYTTWGLEDRDFSLRLRHAGVALKCLRFAANEFHLYHPSEAKKSVVNSEQFNQCAAQKRIRAEKGLDQYL